MGKTTAVALAEALGGVTLLTTTLNLYYDGLETELGQLPIMTWIDTVQSVLGTNSYSSSGGTVRIWAAFFGGTQLPLVGLRELEAQAANWRGAGNATPKAVTVQGESDGTFLLYPPPSSGSAGVSTFPTGLGASFQTNQISLLVSRMDQEIPDWFDLPAGLTCLMRELQRDSPARDEEAAAFTSNLRDVFQLLTLAA